MRGDAGGADLAVASADTFVGHAAATADREGAAVGLVVAAVVVELLGEWELLAPALVASKLVLAEVLEEPDVVGAHGAVFEGDLADPVVGRA